MASLVALMAPNIRFSRRIARSPFLRAASWSKLLSANEILADMRSNSDTVCSLIEPGSRLVTSSTPTLLPLQTRGNAAAAPTCASQTPCRQASERASLRKSLLTHSRWSRKACPQTPDPLGVSAATEMSMPRSRAMSSPKPATHRSKSVPGLSKKTAVARKSPLENAALQTCSYNSSGDFAYRIASLVALNAAKVRARLVSKTFCSVRQNRPAQGRFMRKRRLSGRYERPQTVIQSKRHTNDGGQNPENYGAARGLGDRGREPPTLHCTHEFADLNWPPGQLLSETGFETMRPTRNKTCLWRGPSLRKPPCRSSRPTVSRTSARRF